MNDDAAPSTNLRVLVFAASLRKESLNRKLAARAARVAEAAGATVDLASMQDFDVPLYDGDLEASQGIPKGADELRRRLLASDALDQGPHHWTSRFRPQPSDAALLR